MSEDKTPAIFATSVVERRGAVAEVTVWLNGEVILRGASSPDGSDVGASLTWQEARMASEALDHAWRTSRAVAEAKEAREQRRR